MPLNWKYMNFNIRLSVVAAICVLLISESANAFDFGVPWKNFGTPCNVMKKDKNGKLVISEKLWFTHAGVDISAGVGDSVKVNNNLYYHSTHSDTKGWKDHVIACNSVDKKGACTSDKNSVYYDFLHLNASTGLKVGQNLNGVVIGTIAKIDNIEPHLHLSKRSGPLNLAILYKGALPPVACNDSASKKDSNGLVVPDFAENFVKPDTSVVIITKKK